MRTKTLHKFLHKLRALAAPPRLNTRLGALHTHIQAAHAASQDLKIHQIGHPQYQTKALVFASALRAIECSLVVLDAVYKGGCEQMYNTYYGSAQRMDGGGDGRGPCVVRPLLRDVYVGLGTVYAELTFHEAVWADEFPLTKMLVAKIRGEDAWEGGWVFSKFAEDNPVCRWVEPVPRAPRPELQRGQIMPREAFPVISVF